MLIDEFAKDLAGHPVFTVRAPLSPLFLMIPWQFGENMLGTFCINKGRSSIIAVDEKVYFKISEDRFMDFFNKRVNLNELKSEYNDVSKKIAGVHTTVVAMNVETLSDTELQSHISNILNLFKELANKTVYVETIDREMVVRVIGAKRASLVTNDVWEKATHPAFLSFENRRDRILLDMLQNKAPQEIIPYVRYIFTDYFWTKDDGEIEKYLVELKANCSTKESDLASAKSSVVEKSLQLTKWAMELDETARNIVEYLQFVMWVRDIRKDTIAMINAISAKLGSEMLRRAEINSRLASVVLLGELIKGVQYIKEHAQNIVERPQGSIAYVRPDGSYSVELCNYEDAIAEFERKIMRHSVDSDRVMGQVANKGKAKGIARIVLDPHNVKEFNLGDILVASMTRPEFVPLMKLAGAIVTNEGGITCHAAIVSRELNIPCIIGTKTATLLFKDGDTVEVDANIGVAKKI